MQLMTYSDPCWTGKVPSIPTLLDVKKMRVFHLILLWVTTSGIDEHPRVRRIQRNNDQLDVSMSSLRCTTKKIEIPSWIRQSLILYNI